MSIAQKWIRNYGLTRTRLRVCVPAGLAGLLAVTACSDDTPTAPEQAIEAAPNVSALAASRGSWGRRANLPSTERVGLAAGVVTTSDGQFLYVVGGATSTVSGASLSKVQAYNVAGDTWLYRSPLPIPLYWTNGIGVIGENLYISGGLSGNKQYSSALFMYNSTTDTWTRKRDMPNTTFRGVTGVINDQLYVLTGCDQEDCDSFDAIAFYRYDPVTDLWTELPEPANWHGWGMGGVLGGKFYVTGSSPALDVYDPATNQWSSRAPMPSRRWMGVGVTMANRLYVIGGLQEDASGTVTASTTTFVYNPVQDRWTTEAPLPQPRANVAGGKVLVDGVARIHVVGGPRPGNNRVFTR